MNFLTATTCDILRISRSEDFNRVVNAFDTLEEFGCKLDDFAEDKTVDLLLAGEELSLDDVEYFAKVKGLIDNEKDCSKRFNNQYFKDGDNFNQGEHSLHSEFKFFLHGLQSSGEIHQLQYEIYKYIGKHA